ncbi:MAG TPA: DUF927 domain-containing protein [Candidatus Gastranaerophilales bacterium]|nr:DUF927 domain-containing protein [Candidatus Gastranaerophilales bacterium]
MSDSEFKPEDINHSPLEAGQIQLNEFLNDNCPDFKDSSFLNPKYFKYDESVNVKGHKRRLMEVKDYIAKVEIDGENKSVSTIPKVAGIIKATYVIDQIFNNRTNKKTITYYEAKIIEAISGRESIMSIGYVDLADNKSFKTKVNVFSTLKNDECTEFIATFISKSNPLKIEEYTNTGRMDLVKNNWLWSNAAYYNNKIYLEDKDGNIKVSDNKQVRATKNTGRILPKYVANNKPVEEVIQNLFENIYESWDGALEPYLAICFMALSAYCPEFWRKEGFGSVAFIGETEAGKTEITTLGLGIYGFDKFFMGTTRNTLVGVEQKMNTVNCVPVIIDDISKFKMEGNNFADELKRLMSGLPREKGKTGQESGTLPPCCPFGFSTNYLPVEKPEIMNRLLYLNTDNVVFNPQKFKYFDKGIDELSCILPYILDFGFDRVNKFHTDRKNWLIEHYTGISDRMASQIAIALAGMDVFTEIAKSKLKLPLDKFHEYVNSCMQRFKTAQSPLDKLLEAFPIMIWNGNIKEGYHYKISTDEGFTKLTLHKRAICLAYNTHVVRDSSEHIDSRSIKNKNTEFYQILKFNKSQDYGGGEKHHSVVLDITNHPSTEIILENHFELKHKGLI